MLSVKTDLKCLQTNATRLKSSKSDCFQCGFSNVDYRVMSSLFKSLQTNVMRQKATKSDFPRAARSNRYYDFTPTRPSLRDFYNSLWGRVHRVDTDPLIKRDLLCISIGIFCKLHIYETPLIHKMTILYK